VNDAFPARAGLARMAFLPDVGGPSVDQEPDLLRVHLRLCAAAAVGDAARPDLGAEAVVPARRL